VTGFVFIILLQPAIPRIWEELWHKLLSSLQEPHCVSKSSCKCSNGLLPFHTTVPAMFSILDRGSMHIQKWRQPIISFNMFQLSASLNRWKKPMSSYIDEKPIPFASLGISLALSLSDFSLIYRSWIDSERTIVNDKNITCTSRVARADFAHLNPFSFWWQFCKPPRPVLLLRLSFSPLPALAFPLTSS